MIEVHFCEEDRFYLIAECPSGVHYIAQAGGIMCRHPEVEGAIIAASQVDMADSVQAVTMCALGCYGERLKAKDVGRANDMLASLVWGCFSSVENLRIDETRLDECTEGWWCVTFSLAYTISPESVTSHKGIVCGPNCD